ncbi:hypothetical protein C0J52_20258 [Blattella germanica]|nr:hypothetical protein C0J52_20258 [Blattella germanica]
MRIPYTYFNNLTAAKWPFRLGLVTILRIRLLILSFWYIVQYGSVHTYFHTMNTRMNRLALGTLWSCKCGGGTRGLPIL